MSLEDYDITGATNFKNTPKIKEMVKILIEKRDDINNFKKQILDEVLKQPHSKDSIAPMLIENSIEFLLRPKWERDYILKRCIS